MLRWHAELALNWHAVQGQHLGSPCATERFWRQWAGLPQQLAQHGGSPPRCTLSSDAPLSYTVSAAGEGSERSLNTEEEEEAKFKSGELAG